MGHLEGIPPHLIRSKYLRSMVLGIQTDPDCNT